MSRVVRAAATLLMLSMLSAVPIRGSAQGGGVPAVVARSDYALPTDVLALVSRPADLYGQRLLLYGRVVAVQVAPSGLAFTVGEAEPRRFSAFLQMGILAPDGAEEIVAVGYNGDPAGIAEGTYVLVYGEPVDVFRGISVGGDEIVQPLVAAALIETG